MLEIEDLHVRYGGIRAVQGVSLKIPHGSIVTPYRGQWRGKIQHHPIDCRPEQTGFRQAELQEARKRAPFR